MKKLLSFALLLMVFTLPLFACSNETDELEGESFSVFTPNPSDDYSESPDNPSNAFVFDFKDKNKMKVISHGEEFKGTYELKDTELLMTIDDKDKNTVDLVIKEFSPHEKNEDIYIGKIAKSEVPENHKLKEIFYSFSKDDAIGFQKFKD